MSSHQFSSARELLDRVSMVDVLGGLGAVLPRRGNRTKCPVHNGENETFSFNESKGTWYCFACNEGGGKVALVSRVHNCKPQDALKWIAGLVGIELDRWTKAESQRHAQVMQEAGAKGMALVEWRNQIIDNLRERRDVYQQIYHLMIRVGRNEEESSLWAVICDFDRRIQWHRNAPWPWLAEIHHCAMGSREVA